MKQLQKIIATCKYSNKTTNRKKKEKEKRSVGERSLNVVCFTTTRWRHNSSLNFFLCKVCCNTTGQGSITKRPHSQAFFIDLYRSIYILRHFRWWPLTSAPTESWLLAVLSQNTHPIAIRPCIYPSIHLPIHTYIQYL